MQTPGYQTAKAAPFVSACAAPQMAAYVPQPGVFGVPAPGAYAVPGTYAVPPMGAYAVPPTGAYAVPTAGACPTAAAGVAGIPQVTACPSPEATAMAIGLPVSELRNFIMQSLPVAAIAHSYHVDALANPNLRANAAFQRFSEVELNELHHQVALLGALLRLDMGDVSAIADIGLNLAGFLQNRQMAGQLASRLPASVRQDPMVATVLSLVNQSNQQLAQNWPTITRTLTATTTVAPTAITTAPLTNVK